MMPGGGFHLLARPALASVSSNGRPPFGLARLRCSSPPMVPRRALSLLARAAAP